MTYGNEKWHSLDGGDGKPKPRGLAALKLSDPVRFAEIVSKGGKASPTSFNKVTSEVHKEFSSRGGKAGKKNAQNE